MQYVSVLDKNNQPLMPCHPARARELIKKGRAIKRWFRGVFAIKLLDREGGDLQPIAVGVDPGSKREGFTVKSEAHTLINIQTHAVDWVGKAMETRRNLRRTRRYRNTPYRKNKLNRKRGGLPPSTKARWQWRLRILNWLRKLYPITTIIVEDVKAVTKPGKARWNRSFSPLQVGKSWFYDEIRKFTRLELVAGYETSELRKSAGLGKSTAKLSSGFHSHCVDSFIMASKVVGGSSSSDNKQVVEVIPLRFHRRQLHVQNFSKGGFRKKYGGTRSLGFTRGSLVTHPKHGLCYVGGTSEGRISLHSLTTAKRISRSAKPEDLVFLSYNSWRCDSPRRLKEMASSHIIDG